MKAQDHQRTITNNIKPKDNEEFLKRKRERYTNGGTNHLDAEGMLIYNA